MKSYIPILSNETRRAIYSEVLKYLPPVRVKEIVGEHAKTYFWSSRAKISDETIEKLMQNLPTELKLRILDMIESEIKMVLEQIEDEKRKLRDEA
ncbi:hypothetical protein SUSAZ_08330 [Sulfolobus acidocaldarius SUSAZ]|nr:hypothetical protein SUSAZ_08330 [Sulfolobus acidocaldarius SUSAZ]